MKRLIIHHEAEAELKEAAAFYEGRVAGLGLEFESAICRSFRSIQRDPASYPHYKQTRLQQFVLRRFPYVIFYREFPEQISLVAIAHAKRRPGYWRTRVPNLPD